MTLPKRQMQSFMISDDQDSTITYKGNWSHDVNNSSPLVDCTYSWTTTPGSSFSFTFAGSKATLFGWFTNNTGVGNVPTANYMVDGIHAGSQMPYLDNNTNFSLVYFQTTVLVDKIHTIDVNVTGTNISNPYIIDYFLYIPPPGAANSGVETTRMAPSPTITLVPTTISQSTPIGGIVGGIVGGIAGTAILLFIAYYFLIRRPCDPRAECPDKAGADDFPAGNGHIEPFYATMSSPINPRFTPTTEKGALVAQQSRNAQQPPQPRDYEIWFNENGEGEFVPSRPLTPGPPTYSPD